MSGVKHDLGKDPWHLLPWDAVREVVRVLAFGAKKYAARNWEQGLVHSRTFAASERHGVAWFQFGEDADPDTGLHPLAHRICEDLFALAFILRGRKDLDDRPCAAPAEPPASIQEALERAVSRDGWVNLGK